jgi:plasmid stabilization system protein ParE
MFNLIITDLAKSDLRDIRIYYNKFSKEYSKKLVETIKNSIRSLKQFPEFGKEIGLCREVIYGDYRIMYIILENNIYIIRVIHSSMNFTFN